MDRQLDIDNFERLLKDRSEEFKMYPTKRVWHSIYNNIHPGKKWPSIATCIVLISILLLVGFLNTNDTISKVSIAKNQQSLPSTAIVLQNEIFKNPSLLIAQNNKLLSDHYTTTADNNINILQYSGNPSFKLPAYHFFENILMTGYENKSEKILTFSDRLQIINLTGPNQLSTNAKKLDISTGISKSKTVIFKTTPAILANNFNSSPNVSEAINNTDNETNVVINTAHNNDIFNLIETPDQLTESEIVLPKELLKLDNSSIANLRVGITAYNTAINKKNIKKVSGISTKLSTNEIEFKPLVLTESDKAWVENFALYNRPVPKKWAGKLAWQLYFTPSVVYRTLKNNKPNETDINKEVTDHPSMGLEIGAGIIYPITKGLKIKTGLQLNFTRYNTEAYENSHPVSTSISLNDTYGLYYENSRTTPFSNYGGITPTNLHNDTYQISIPLGTEIKIAGNDNLQWNIGATIQPTYVFGGRSYLISADKRNFIKETTFLNRFNLNAGFETFISYKLDGFTFQFGPQFRKQIFTTNSKVYTVQEKLNNYGIRFGITKIIK